MSVLAAILLALAPVQAQDNKAKPIGAHPKVDQQKVDEAIKKGCAILAMGGGGFGFGTFTHGKRNQPDAVQCYGELVLLTLLHSGYYDENSPELQGLIGFLVERPITSTYTASLGAMAFQKLNAKKYQARIAQYAQFLCDNQAENGQWDYGEPGKVEEKVPTTAPKAKPQDVATAGNAGGATPGASSAPAGPKKEVGKTAALPKIPIRKKRPGPPNGDNSNSQYAALGLRACLDAGIDVDPRVLTLAKKWWTTCQNSDGGWGYNDSGGMGGEENPESVSNTSYGSMTVGAVGALCIYDYYLGLQYKNDGNVIRGLEWLAKNYDVTKNPKKNQFAYLYYLYGLERVGMLYGTEKIGPNEWYPDGANHLLSTQLPGGGWSPPEKIPGGLTTATCFAILFLRRGTPPLKAVATGGGREPGAPPGQAVANAGANPQANAGGLSGLAAAVNQIAPGWRLIGHLSDPKLSKLGDARGKPNVLTTTPPNLSSTPTLRKTVEIAAGSKCTLRLIVGHHEQSFWTLIVRADGKDLVTKVVGKDTAKEGWLEVSVDLSAYAGKSPLIEVIQQADANGLPFAYWSEVALLDR
jgi:hypothetical protein